MKKIAMAFVSLGIVPACVGAGSSKSDALIYSFTGGSDGGLPNSALVADKLGNLYGTTFWGGSNNDASCGGQGCGVVFQLSPPIVGETTWSETPIYQFPGGPSGALPRGSIAVDPAGNLYGSTSWGGTGTQCGQNACGVVYELSPPAQAGQSWTQQTIYNFQGGRDAWGGANLMFAADGNIYGTSFGGGEGCSGFGCGTVFRLAPPAHGSSVWTETILHRFMGDKDGSGPEASVIMDRKGNLYGTTSDLSLLRGGGGTAFMLAPPPGRGERWTETVLYKFPFRRGHSGTGSYSPLISDRDGNLYGTTDADGSGCAVGCGTLFELSPPAPGTSVWQEKTLYEFHNHGQRGAVYPAGGIVAGKDGRFYATTLRGGSVDQTFCKFDGPCGAFVELLPPGQSGEQWTMRVLHRFQGAPGDAGNTQAGLLRDGHGHLFGTSAPAGSNGEWGAVFEVDE